MGFDEGSVRVLHACNIWAELIVKSKKSGNLTVKAL